jgi:hypothetical protein
MRLGEVKPYKQGIIANSPHGFHLPAKPVDGPAVTALSLMSFGRMLGAFDC